MKTNPVWEPPPIANQNAGHVPYVPDSVVMPEFTLQAVLVGAVLGIIFGASSLYLVLKVGLTVSASIPVAVLSITLFRALSKLPLIRRATILENNIVQTTGSAGESIAFGVGVTMPALMLLGFDMSIGRVMIVSLLGGILGILMMIPLRRAFIVNLHGRPGEPGKLLYPEGTACAQVLISGETGGTSGKTVFVGFALAFAHKFITEGMNLMRATVSFPLGFFNKAAVISGDMASELLGVGYIIGVRTSSTMMAGAVLGYLVIAPAIFLFGSGLDHPLGPTDKLIRDMSLTELRANYILFIGAGCVATAGIISMGRTLPVIARSISAGLKSLRAAQGQHESNAPAVRRTDRDMSMRVVIFGSLGLIGLLAIFLAQDVPWFGAILGAMLVVLFGFLFVTVSSRLTGEIGSSSNPISGMTVATLSLTCLIFLALGMTSPIERVLALSIGAVVCIAASNGGTTSQDLKTGFLIGATPRSQQWAIIVGALTSALVIGGTLLLFNAAGTVYSQKNLPAINLKSALANLPQIETYNGDQFHVWRPTRENDPAIEPGKYLVDDAGQVRYLVDPAVTGTLTQRDRYEPKTLDNINLKDQIPKLTETETYRGQMYHVWRPAQDQPSHTENGRYLVDDSGAVRYLVISSKVNLKFEAPKTQLMALIINGVLGHKLNWGLVLMGAMISIMLELCGIPSLAFAVGVYVQMSVSVPIFIGGLVRWMVDRIMRKSPALAHVSGQGEDDDASRAHAQVQAIAEAESSPGVLLASGYIAGGTLGGVLIAFMEFAPKFKERLDYSQRVEHSWGNADWPALLAFAGLIALLILVGAGQVLKSQPPATVQSPGVTNGGGRL